MALTEAEWESIRTFVERIVGRVAGNRRDFFVTGRVVKCDAANRCVFLDEFGDQPIPLVGYKYEISYYIESGGSTVKRTATATPSMPKVGESVLVARELGTRRLPRCLGVILGTNWIVPGDMEDD